MVSVGNVCVSCIAGQVTRCCTATDDTTIDLLSVLIGELLTDSAVGQMRRIQLYISSCNKRGSFFPAPIQRRVVYATSVCVRSSVNIYTRYTNLFHICKAQRTVIKLYWVMTNMARVSKNHHIL